MRLLLREEGAKDRVSQRSISFQAIAAVIGFEAIKPHSSFDHLSTPGQPETLNKACWKVSTLGLSKAKVWSIWSLKKVRISSFTAVLSSEMSLLSLISLHQWSFNAEAQSCLEVVRPCSVRTWTLEGIFTDLIQAALTPGVLLSLLFHLETLRCFWESSMTSTMRSSFRISHLTLCRSPVPPNRCCKRYWVSSSALPFSSLILSS